jgi:hypothetical protein
VVWRSTFYFQNISKTIPSIILKIYQNICSILTNFCTTTQNYKMANQMANLIPPNNYMVVQKAPGGIAPRIQLLLYQRFGPEGLEAQRERENVRAELTRARVHAERVGAVARGVQVVVDETRPDHYHLVDFPDN